MLPTGSRSRKHDEEAGHPAQELGSHNTEARRCPWLGALILRSRAPSAKAVDVCGNWLTLGDVQAGTHIPEPVQAFDCCHRNASGRAGPPRQDLRRQLRRAVACRLALQGPGPSSRVAGILTCGTAGAGYGAGRKSSEHGVVSPTSSRSPGQQPHTP